MPKDCIKSKILNWYCLRRNCCFFFKFWEFLEQTDQGMFWFWRHLTSSVICASNWLLPFMLLFGSFCVIRRHRILKFNLIVRRGESHKRNFYFWRENSNCCNKIRVNQNLQKYEYHLNLRAYLFTSENSKSIFLRRHWSYLDLNFCANITQIFNRANKFRGLQFFYAVQDCSVFRNLLSFVEFARSFSELSQ